MLLTTRGAAVTRLVVRASRLATTRTRFLLSQQSHSIVSQNEFLALVSARFFAAAASNTVSKAKTTKSKASETSATRAKNTKEKTTAKGTKAKPKSKTKSKVKPKKKVLTEQQKVRTVQLKIRELRQTGLVGQEPSARAANAYILFNSKYTRSTTSNPTDVAKEVAAAYKAMTFEELEELKRESRQNNAANLAAYRQWVESHSPAAIFEANRARKQLLRLASEKRKNYSNASFRHIIDARKVDRPLNMVGCFMKEHLRSREFEGVDCTKRFKALGENWRAMSPDERQIYADKAKAEALRYREEYQTVYKQGLPPTYAKKS